MDFISESCSSLFGFIITGDNTSFENFLLLLEQRSTYGKATIYSVQQSKVRSHTTSEANIITVWRVKNKGRVICAQCSAISERHCFECYQASPACLLRVVLTSVSSSCGISCICRSRTLGRLALSVTPSTIPITHATPVSARWHNRRHTMDQHTSWIMLRSTAFGLDSHLLFMRRNLIECYQLCTWQYEPTPLNCKR